MTQSEAFIVELNDKSDYQRILEGKPKTCGMRSGRVFLEPGKACGQHSTKDHEELLVFLTGRGELQIGEPAQHAVPLVVGAGRVAYIPPRTLHDVRNAGDTPLIYIYCVAPADTD
jgi:mannose-6-phosphate isomerase-like protein (cupin superfamily)